MIAVQFLLSFILLSSLAHANLEHHGPRDRFWRHHREQRSLIYNGVNHFDTIEQCLDSLLTAEDKEAMTMEMPRRRVGTTFQDEEHEDEWTFFVSVEDAIAPSHVKAVQALATCLRETIPSSYESRSMYKEFHLDEDIGLGGNCPTHLAPLVGVFLPLVADSMQRTLEVAYEAAGWSTYTKEDDSDYVLPDPKDVGFRACEHLTYKDFNKDGLFDHNDGRDTHYTMNYAFSGPEDYDGGYFYIKLDGKPALKTVYFKPKKYDAMIFLGGRYDHGVTEIMSGHREMFSSELWEYPDSPFGSNLWSNFADRMEEYIRLCDIEADEGHSGPCEVDIEQVFVAETATSTGKVGDAQEKEGGKEDTIVDAKNQSKLSFYRPGREEDEDDTRLIPVRVRDSKGNEFGVADFRPLNEEPYFLVKQKLAPGEIYPIWWRDLSRFGNLEDDYFVVGLPDKLIEAFQTYTEKSGLDDLAKKVLYEDQRILPQMYRMYTLKDGTKWTASMIGEWGSDYNRLESTDERVVSVFPQLLRSGNFDMVMEKIAERLGLSGLLVRGVDATILSKARDGSASPIESDLDDASFRVLIPVRIPAGQSSALVLGVGSEEELGATYAPLNQKVGVGLVLNSETSYYEYADCSYKAQTDFQMSFIVYLDEYDEISTSD